MSFRLVELVIDYGPAEPGLYRVLVALARHGNDDGTQCRPKLPRLARKARMGESEVSHCLTRLRRDGWIHVARKAGRGRSTSWTVNLDRLKDAVDGDLSDLSDDERTRPSALKDATRGRKDATERTKGRDFPAQDSVLTLSKDSVQTHARHELVATNSKTPAKQGRRPAVAASVEPPGFRDFWTAYPRHVARGEAVKSFARALKQDGPDVIETGVASWSAYWRAEGTEARFIPHPTTFLNQARYLDQPPASRSGEPKSWDAIRRWRESQP
jgi:hypothetical protein